MSEMATVTAILERVQSSRQDRVNVSPSALEVAKLHVREQKEIAIIAEEWELDARWRDEEKQIADALAGRGLRKVVKSE